MNSAQALTFGDTKAMKKLLLTALSSLAMGAYAADDHKFYAGGGLSFWELKNSEQGDGKINLSALEASAGYEALPWLAIEGRVGFGIERDREEFSTGLYNNTLNAETELMDFKQDITDAKVELEYYASIYLKPQIKNDTAVLYGLLGYTTYSTTFEGYTQTYMGSYTPSTGVITDWNRDGAATALPSDSQSESNFSMGLGVGFYFKDRYVFNIEYKNFAQSAPVGDTENSVRANGLNFGVNYSF